LDNTIHKKQNKKHNAICVGQHYTQETKQKTQHNMCWTTLYTRNKTKNTTQYVLDNTIHKKQNKKHNAICVGQHYMQTHINNINKT
jgi:hypothetical protein